MASCAISKRRSLRLLSRKFLKLLSCYFTACDIGESRSGSHNLITNNRVALPRRAITATKQRVRFFYLDHISQSTELPFPADRSQRGNQVVSLSNNPPPSIFLTFPPGNSICDRQVDL
ncbi:unnamed protein product [Arabis nemorensis]|uniref:Uncharacterized protein n=1 Tax=Arabis nemorensis TaxID=586526 RepID=A0A565CFK1_9BRAS|nr:unnamed protein product [Arabis nemorensis]